ncbi:MAG TPA: ParB/Srx family N-terminal domain-containing protein [Verrucomicrobiae bacterium]|nr:ParB/Srx family N-terminal domain-containing protein [Verrucomicrobiae bacterium]
MTIHCAHTALVDPATLQPNPTNPNRHGAGQIQLLAAIIRDQGWRAPITVSKRSGLIVRGHGRLEAALLLGCEQVPVDYQDYASEAEELADLLADNRLSELAELDEEGLRSLIAKVRESDPEFDVELTGFMEDEIARLFEGEADEADEQTIPRMEIQPFEHHDYLVFMFHDLRDWMLALQLLGVRQVDYSITRTTKKIGIGRVLHGKRLIELARRANGLAGTGADGPAISHHEPGPAPVDQQPPAVSPGDAGRSRKRA